MAKYNVYMEYIQLLVVIIYTCIAFCAMDGDSDDDGLIGAVDWGGEKQYELITYNYCVWLRCFS